MNVVRRVQSDSKQQFRFCSALHQKQAIAGEFPKFEWETKMNKVLVKVYIAGKKIYKNFLEKLTYFPVENFYSHF